MLRQALVTSFVILLAPAAALACGDHALDAQLKTLSFEQLASRMEQKSVELFDVSPRAAREAYGVIPGARIVNETTFEGLVQRLPKNKAAAVAFYCGENECREARSAAKAALKAGYTDVSVLIGGVRDWFDTGRPVAAWDPDSRS